MTDRDSPVRKVIQIATSAVAFEGEGGSEENFYALDSDGVIYQWMFETVLRTAGWMQIDSPWKQLTELKYKGPKKVDDAERIASWLEKLGDNWPDVPSEIAARVRAGEWKDA